MPAPPLRTRPPTGLAPWPLIVIEGVEKSGKTYSAVELAADPRIGQMFGADLGEGSLDEYGPLSAPLDAADRNDPACWKLRLLDHDGTYRSLADQLWAARSAPRVAPHLPNAILLDTGTDLWWSLARWIEGRARYRAKNIERLAEDPDAELDMGRDLWNDAAERWRNIVEPLRTWDGIAIITARGGWVSGTDRAGQPTRTKVWSTNAHKSLPFDASVIIRMDEGRRASIVAARSLTLQVPHGGAIDLPEGWKVADVIFDRLGLDGATTGARVLTKMTEDWPVPIGKLRLVEAYQRAGLDEDAARTEAREAWTAAGLPNGKQESVDPAAVIALIEAAGGPVGASQGGDPPLVPEPPTQAPTGAEGAGDGPPDDGQVPDPATDDPPEDTAPAGTATEEDRVEMIRAWIEPMERDALVGAMTDVGLDVSGAMPTLRKRMREWLSEQGWVPPADLRHPHVNGHEPTLREAWAAYLANLDEMALAPFAEAAGFYVPLNGPQLAHVVSYHVDRDEWPPVALALGQTADSEGVMATDAGSE